MKQIGTIKTTLSHWWQRVLLWIVAFTTFFLMMGFLYFMHGHLIGRFTSVFITLGSLIVTIVLHEMLHGVFFKVFTGSASYGFKPITQMGPVFWATSDKFLTRDQLRMVSLAPQLLTVVALTCFAFLTKYPAIGLALVIMAAGNLSGGCMDIWTVIYLQRYSEDKFFKDEKVNVSVWEKE